VGAILSLTRPSLSDRLRFYPVGFHVNNPRNDDRTCIQPDELRVEDF
jgi:hypothetical protein